MKISKKDAVTWFRFFADMEVEELTPKQLEIALSALSQLERAVEERRSALIRDIPNLHTLKNRTFYVGNPEKFSRGCVSCLTGTGLGAVRRTHTCNANCPFCYDYGLLDQQTPVGEGMWEIGGTKFCLEDLELLLDVSNRPTGISYVYLEPFMEIEVYYPAIEIFHRAGIYQHMYTNGINATPENLAALGKAGLNELRFNLGATNAADDVIEMIAEAKRYIPAVGIETPMTPEFYDVFLTKIDKIRKTGVDFINCAELHLNENNIENYWGEPMYMCRQGYISPVWSRDLTLRLMARASRESWEFAVHDCSNHTKFARDLNLRAKEGGWFGASSYGMEFGSIPYAAFITALEDASLPFMEEEPLPKGYRFEDVVV